MDIREDFMLAHNQNVEQNEKLSAKSKRRMQKSKAFNTIKSYASDWNDFADWCEHQEKCALPAEPETIVNYINDLADNAKANTVSRRVTAISENHIAAGYKRDNPAHSGLVRNAMSAIRREKGTFQHGKAPILLETLYLIADGFGEDETSIRDRALLLLGFAGAFRRSELVALSAEDIKFSAEGMVVFIGKSKGDQLGKGSYIGIPYAPDAEICAVRALRASKKARSFARSNATMSCAIHSCLTSPWRSLSRNTSRRQDSAKRISPDTACGEASPRAPRNTMSML